MKKGSGDFNPTKIVHENTVSKRTVGLFKGKNWHHWPRIVAYRLIWQREMSLSRRILASFNLSFLGLLITAEILALSLWRNTFFSSNSNNTMLFNEYLFSWQSLLLVSATFFIVMVVWFFPLSKHGSLRYLLAIRPKLTKGKFLNELSSKFEDKGSTILQNNLPEDVKITYGKSIDKRLKAFCRGYSEHGFLILKGVFLKHPIGAYYSQIKRYIKLNKIADPVNCDKSWNALHNAIVALGIATKLNTTIRDKVAKQPRWSRDYKTNSEAIKDHFDDGGDLHLRYRTAAPHMQFPSDTEHEDSAAPRYVIFNCIRNNIDQHIQVLHIDNVIKCFDDAIKELKHEDDVTSEETLDVLCQVHIKRFDVWDPKKMSPSATTGVAEGPILKKYESPNGNIDWWIAWDINRTEIPGGDQPGATNIRKAMGILRRAIRIADRKYTIPVHLKAGDALLLDNQKCLIRRTEDNKDKWIWFLPNDWWLRAYYCFRSNQIKS